MSECKVVINGKKRVYDGHLKVDVYDISLNGKSIVRELCVTKDSVVVLPYDPVMRKILLVKEPRTGLIPSMGENNMTISTIAGCLDKSGSTVIDIIRDELNEEAGIANFDEEKLTFLRDHFGSPGIMSERKSIYIYEIDSREVTEGVYGLENEGEYIQTMLVDYDEAKELCDNNLVLDLSCVYAIEKVLNVN